MAITRFILPLTCALFLPLAAAAQTTPAAPADACCAAMHQMPATDAAPVDHSAHQAADAAKPAMPGMKADADGCCGTQKADQPMAKMDCCAGMDANDGKDAKPCEHCAAHKAPTPTDKVTDAPAPACCDHQAATDDCCN